MKKSKLVALACSLAVNLTVRYFFDLTITPRQILTIHVFLFVLLLLTDLIQKKLSKKESVGPATLLSVHFLRILLCLGFLLPIIISAKNTSNTYIYNFFFVYFFLLFFEVFLKYKNK